MQRAIEMPLGERQARYKALWRRVADQDVVWWREHFLASLAKATKTRQRPVSAAPQPPTPRHTV